MILGKYHIQSQQYLDRKVDTWIRLIVDGKEFTINEKEGKLSISCDGQLVVEPKSSNVIEVDTRRFS